MKLISAVLGDEEKGGRMRVIRQYVEQIPIPNASDDEREAIANLAGETQNLHATRSSRTISARHRNIARPIFEPQRP